MTSKITHNELKEDIKLCYKTQTPLFVWGAVGIGKSQTIRETAQEIAKEQGLEFCDTADSVGKFGFLDVRISQLEPSDLRGLPAQDLEKENTKWLIPNWLPRDKESKGILFFDELNLSPPSIQAVAYQLILDRRIGDYILPKGWVIISAGNRSEDRCGVFEMSNALSNRFIHAELEIPSVEDWTSWAIENNIDNRITAFVNFKADALYKADSKIKQGSFPTPRSWAFCSRLISGQTKQNRTERLVASSVGYGVSKEFIGFLRLQKHIDIDEILNKPQNVESIKEIDLKYVLIGTIAEKYRSNKKSFEKILPICEYLDAEFSILLLRFLKGADKTHFTKAITTSEKGKKLLIKYGEILR